MSSQYSRRDYLSDLLHALEREAIMEEREQQIPEEVAGVEGGEKRKYFVFIVVVLSYHHFISEDDSASSPSAAAALPLNSHSVDKRRRKSLLKR